MSYKYTHFIPQNTAPNGAKEIGVYNANGEKIHTILLGRLAPPAKEKLYSFGLVSDTHIGVNGRKAKLSKALKFMKTQGVDFCCNTGDVTNRGYYDSSLAYEPSQFTDYFNICSECQITVYNAYGNHDSYFKNISETLDGGEIAFCFEKEYQSESGMNKTDVFVFVGQSTETGFMSNEHFDWLGVTLEANKDKRCFVFVHSYIEEDSGDPLDVCENSIFDNWDTTKKKAFINLLNLHENVILFHGHSHTKFQCQELDINANYTERNGFKSVHVPSLGTPRDIDLDNGKTVDDPEASQGYIVDVYEDCIVLNGMDFVANKPVPLGVYKIDTTRKL